MQSTVDNNVLVAAQMKEWAEDRLNRSEFEWVKQPSIIRPVLLKTRLGVSWMPEFIAEEAISPIALARRLANIWVGVHLPQIIKAGPADADGITILKLESFQKAAAAHAYANDPVWAARALKEFIPGPITRAYVGAYAPRPRTPRDTITISVLEVVVSRTEYRRVTFDRTYTGDLELDKETVMEYLAEDDQDGLADYIRESIDEDYINWSASDDDDDGYDITDSNEDVTQIPDADDLANDLESDWGEEARPEQEE